MALRRRILALLSAVLGGALLLAALGVAPLAFRILPDDRVRAGTLAAEVFELTYWFALAVGVVALLFGDLRRPRPTLTALLLVVLSGVQLGLVAPLLATHGAGWPFSFAALHGTASAVHLALIAAALGLAWMFSSPS